MFKKLAIGLATVGLLGIGSAIAPPNVISKPLDFSKESGFQKLFPDAVDGSIWYYKPTSVKVLNRRKKTISLGVYIRQNKDMSYSWTNYIISCADGTFQETARIFYNNQGEIHFGSTEIKAPEEISDDSDYGKLRDRLCKNFGF